MSVSASARRILHDRGIGAIAALDHPKRIQIHRPLYRVGQPVQVGLALWLSNLLLGPGLEPERERFLATLASLPGRVILVSNEVGWGIVPINELARHFADEQGRLNQAVAALSDRVTLVAAGLPLELKGGAC